MTLTDSWVIILGITIVYKMILEYESKNRQHPNQILRHQAQQVHCLVSCQGWERLEVSEVVLP